MKHANTSKNDQALNTNDHNTVYLQYHTHVSIYIYIPCLYHKYTHTYICAYIYICLYIQIDAGTSKRNRN